ncbi:hypothetical protein BGZ74_005664 [Mortierella antarctica]|nr:hypothetical protein BGZ74_005664 [Mortierella antarctica]
MAMSFVATANMAVPQITEGVSSIPGSTSQGAPPPVFGSTSQLASVPSIVIPARKKAKKQLQG